MSHRKNKKKELFRSKKTPTEITERQHFLECDNCETKPAQFHCKTCQGHLCDDCRKIHETKRLTQGHVIILLSDYIADPVGCHQEEEDQCACKIRQRLKAERKEINAYWLPLLEQMQDEEKKKQSRISRKVEKIKDKVEEHFDNIIDKFTKLKDESIKQLEEDAENASDAIEKTIDEIEDKIELLGDRDSEIKDYLSEEDEDMHEGMCMPNKEGRLIPKRVSYEVHKFCPGSLDASCLLQVFGDQPSVAWQ
nr:tripartite motif-containing protein 45-like [Crassostrea gigas]